MYFFATVHDGICMIVCICKWQCCLWTVYTKLLPRLTRSRLALSEFSVKRPLRLDLCQTPLFCATIGNIPVLTGLATLTFWSWGCLEKIKHNTEIPIAKSVFRQSRPMGRHVRHGQSQKAIFEIMYESAPIYVQGLGP